MSPTRRLAAAALLLAAACTTMPARHQRDRSGADLEAGSYGVGYRQSVDGGVWYPAAGGGVAMRFRDYAGSAASAGLPDRQMMARRDAPPLAKKSPVAVIVMNDGEASADYAPVAEFLASHGYTIAAASAKASLQAVEGSEVPLLLHHIDVSAGALHSEPASAKKRAGKLLVFLDRHFARP